MFLATLPLADQAGGDVEIAGEDSLADPFAQPQFADLFGFERCNRGQTHLVEPPHRPLIHHASGVEFLGCLVDRGHYVASVLPLSLHA